MAPINSLQLGLPAQDGAHQHFIMDGEGAQEDPSLPWSYRHSWFLEQEIISSMVQTVNDSSTTPMQAPLMKCSGAKVLKDSEVVGNEFTGEKTGFRRKKRTMRRYDQSTLYVYMYEIVRE